VTRGHCAQAGRLVVAWTTVGLLASCGGSAGDLLALEVSGGFQSEPVRLTVTDDGRGRCDDGALEPISSERLIEAREVERELEGLAEEGARFAGGKGAEGRRYVASIRAGTVRWSEGGAALPEVLPRAALLAEQLQDDLCG
jgi:hypothetical protein